MDAGTLILIAVLLVAAMALITVEICTPFFGLLSALAVAMAGLAVYLSWSEHQLFGLATGLVCVVGLPLFAIPTTAKSIPTLGLYLASNTSAVVMARKRRITGAISQ